MLRGILLDSEGPCRRAMKSHNILFLKHFSVSGGLISQHLMEPDTQHPISATRIGKGAESHSSSWEVL